MLRVGALCALLAAAVAATVAPAAPAAPGATECVRTVAGLDLQTTTIADLQREMGAGRLTSARLVDAYEARIAAYDTAGPKLDAIRQLNPQAHAQAEALDAERNAGHVRGPLHGIPVLLKDNYGTADQPTTAGSIALDGVVPKDDSTVTRKLREAGAVILGKANLSEFAGWVDLNMPAGYSSLGGQVINAHDPEFSPSGSSAGSGVAASMAFSGATMGTETSGSILSPSDANGVVGVKTTLGLVSRFGILPLAPDFDVPGPIVRSTTDAAIMLGALAGPDEHDPATADAAKHLPPGGDYTASLKTNTLKDARLAYSQDAYDSLDDEHRALFDAGIERLKRLGAEVVPVESMRAESSGLAEIGAIPNEFKASLNRYLAEQMPDAPVHSLSEIIAFNDQHPDRVKYGQGLLQASDATPGREELFAPQAEPARESARQTIDGALAEGQADAIITPGNAHANIGAAAGYPTVIEPLGYTDGGKHPFGLGFLGPAYSEPTLLGFAYAYEQDAHARVAPNAVNPAVEAVPCAEAIGDDRGSSAARPVKPLRVVVHFHGHRQLRVSVLHVRGRHTLISVRRGKKLLLQRYPRVKRGTGHLRMTARRRGLYRVTAFDPGPPSRTARAKRRIR
jgi:Asp-tRNA(Asn)/Glu-tRNA(Gln) amidotransferase A subunit family amidase